jgi:predicted metal-binding protein
VRISVCVGCPLGASGFVGRLATACIAGGVRAGVSTVECTSGCARPSAVAVRASGKTAYLFGDLAEGDLPGLMTFLRLYEMSPDGNFADARPLGPLRHKVIARIPA